MNCLIKDCNEEAVYSVIYQGRRIQTCEAHYRAIFESYYRKGAEAFYGWLIQMTGDIERANKILIQMHGEGEEIKKLTLSPDGYWPMFTFGILKFPENIVEQGGRNIVENATVKGHVMYATGGRGFPVTKVTGNPSNVVYGTYFEMPIDMVLYDFDLTEGYAPYNSPEDNMYNRKMVEVTLSNGQIKEANMYIANVDWFATDMVEDFRIITGNWNDRYTHTVLALKRDGEI